MPCAYSVIIPAYNEEETIRTAVRQTVRAFDRFKKSYEIIVVDDGSRDRTAKIVEQLRRHIPMLRLVRHTQNQGKGAAVKTGVLAARGDVFLFLDSDLATRPSEFAAFIPKLKTHDIIIGSRRVTGAHIAERQPLYRVWLGRAFNLFIRLYLDLPFSDTQCGFKAFSKKAAPLFADLKSSGWTFDVELLVRARQRGFTIAEVPVTWRNRRESKVRMSHALSILRELYRIKHAHLTIR